MQSYLQGIARNTSMAIGIPLRDDIRHRISYKYVCFRRESAIL
jgi:hypothetical protein